MDRRILLSATFVGTIFTLGCSGGSGSTTAAVPEQAPEQVVTDFLEAVRHGDDRKATTLLTPLARQRTSESQMVVAPPGSDTATFKVDSSQQVADEIHVATDWTDLDIDGRPHTDRIGWILKRGVEGWRISGMSASVFPDQAPIALNFEDPADMIQKQQQAEEEIARREAGKKIRVSDPSGGGEVLVR